MGTAKRTRDIGAVPSGLTTDQQRFLEQVRRRLQDLSGTNGSRAGQAVTWDDLRAGGLVGGDLQIPAGGFTQDGTPDLTPPPTPVGLSAVAALTNIIITTSDPVFLVGHGYARTLVYGAQVTDQVPNPVFADAQKIHEFVGSVGSYPTDPGSHWRLWATWLSNDGVQSFTPAGPVDATTGLIDGHDLSDDLDLAEHLADGSISGSKLAAGAIDATKFANDIEPVTIVDAPSLPTTKSTTNIVWQGALYTWDGTEYKSPDIGDITFEDIGGTIDASQVAAGILDATKFASGLEPVTVVPGSTLPTAKSTSVIVFGGKLYRWNGSAYVASVLTTDISGTITSTQIEDGAISTPKLAANAVTASKIAADAVTADKIAANAVTTAKLAAGAVTADQIAAGAITADKILIGDYTNYAYGSDAWTNTPWDIGSPFAVDTTFGRTDSTSLKISGSAGSGTRYSNYRMQVSPGDQIYVELWAYRDADWNGTSNNSKLSIRNDAGGALLGQAGYTSAVVAATWTKLATTITVPAGCSRVYFDLRSDASAGNCWLDDIIIRKVTQGTTIADGSITTDKVQANSITASKLTISDMSNLVPDEQITEAAAWELYSGWSLVASGAPTGFTSVGYILSDASTSTVGTARTGKFAVDEGAQYYASYQTDGQNNAQIGAAVYWINASGADISSTNIGNAPASVGAVARYGATVTAPAGAKYANIRISYSGSAAVKVGGLIVRRAASAELIVDGAITATKIAADAVTADKIAANAVTTAALAAGAVTADQIAAGAITASKLTVADYSNLITNSEFAGGSTEDWTLGTGVSLASAPSNMPCSYALQFNVVSSSRYTATYSKAIPCMPGESYYASMIVRGSGTGPQFNPRMRIEWFDRNNASLSVVWLSSQQTIVSPVTLSGIFVAPDSATQMRVQLLREVVTGESQNGYIARPVIRRAASAELIVDGAVTANKIAANAIAVGTAAIQDGAIVNAMIGAAAIDDAKVGNLSASKLTAGDGTVGGILKNSNFATGSAGWRLQPNGNAEFNNAVVRGTIYATAGTVGGWTIGSNYIRSSNWAAGDTGVSLGSGGTVEIRNSDNSRVLYLQATGTTPAFKFPGLEILGNGNATFSGNLSAAGGTFKGSLSAATGTFSGSLSAADGTFAGTLTASAVNAVDTINISGNAVSTTNAATATNTLSFGNGSEQSVLSLTVNTYGGQLLIHAGLLVPDPYLGVQGKIILRLKRNGTTIKQFSVISTYVYTLGDNSVYYGWSSYLNLPLIVESVGTETRTYELTAALDGTGGNTNWKVSDRAIVITEFKR